jgi:hypothetical protein
MIRLKILLDKENTQMSDNNFDADFKEKGFGLSIHPSILAALIFALPFIAVDFFNYYSAGTALALSLPVLALMYAGCGALATFFAIKQGRLSMGFPLIGALAGLMLWFVSTLVNTILSLILGTASVGLTLLLGIPYLCICAPIQLIGSGLMGALGGFLLGLFYGNKSSSDF